jgi:hypothetical protein
MSDQTFTLPQLSELLQLPLPALVRAREMVPACPVRRDRYGRCLYSKREASLFGRHLLEHDPTVFEESSAAARAEYLAAIVPEGATAEQRTAALEAELRRIINGEVESTAEQENALLEALAPLPEEEEPALTLVTTEDSQ